MPDIRVEVLDAATFAPFGHVIETAGRATAANQGRARRFDLPFDLAGADARAARLQSAVYRISASALPFELGVVERHALSPQLFFPNSGSRFLACACPTLPDGAPDLDALRAWVGHCSQGLVWRAGVWHGPLVALDEPADFLMQQWQCDGPLDCEERTLAMPMRIRAPT